MRKISGNLFMAIDGVVESPKKWSLSYCNDNIANVVMGGMQGADALLHPQLSRKLIKTFPDTAKSRRSSYKPRGS